MNLTNIDTKNCLFNPKSPAFMDEMGKEPEFNFRPYKVPLQNALTYIVLVYDPESQLFKKEQDSIKRKEHAAIASGMPYTKKEGFSKESIEILLGQNEKVNEAIAKYVCMSNSVHVMALCSYERYYEQLIRDSFTQFKNFEPKNTEIIAKLLEKILDLRKKILGGEESYLLHKTLTTKFQKISETLKIENINDQFEENGLDGFSPYGNYRPSPLKFAGDNVPQE